MMRKMLTIMAVLALAGCASTAMKQYVGKSVSEAYMKQGQPAAIFDLPDGRRAFQFYWGGGAGVIQGSQRTTISPTGGGAYAVTTTGVPATFVSSEGCLVTLIARPSGKDFIVEEYRIPKRAVC